MKQYAKPVFDDAHDERRQAEQEQQQRREALRLRVRQALPQVTKWADDVRQHFPGARLVWAAERQHVVGKVPADVRRQHEAEFGPLVDVGKEK